ncbi:hypothetical protein SAMN05660445_00876 [Salegentibacter salarius]|nr:hypothetical protein SAMN05660445_00876 [Salegentibacter salarius]
MTDQNFYIGILLVIVCSVVSYFQVKDALKIKKNDETRKYYKTKILGSLLFFFVYGIYLIFS